MKPYSLWSDSQILAGIAEQSLPRWSRPDISDDDKWGVQLLLQEAGIRGLPVPLRYLD